MGGQECDCRNWVRDYKQYIITDHHRKCGYYNLEKDSYDLINALLTAMRIWGSRESGIPETNGIANTYNIVSIAIGKKII